MARRRKHITVFEHGLLHLGQRYGDVTFDSKTLEALQGHHGQKGVLYYSLTHRGVRFNEHVGVIQAGDTLIEILPKADQDNGQTRWRRMLIDMLKAVGLLKVSITGQSDLRLRSGTVLDLYIELFIQEVEYLQRTGLIKRYRKKEGNALALKGNLLFGKHIQHNLVHKERFYVRHSTYDLEHRLHQVIYKAIQLLPQINTDARLHGRIGALTLNFPEMPSLRVDESTFSRMTFDRQSRPYQTAMQIARLLLLQYHPDVSQGRDHVLALVFSMNRLWEAFIYKSLRGIPDFTVTAQNRTAFWRSQKGSRVTVRPDILLKKKDGSMRAVLDTKWKNIGLGNPAIGDLRQMYVYNRYFDAQKAALVYPGEKYGHTTGNFIKTPGEEGRQEHCSVICIETHDDIRSWQNAIRKGVLSWMESEG